MGGGADSRIPGLLKGYFAPEELRVVIRTYSFDPEIGRAQIASWVETCHPDLVVGESLGAIQALRVRGVPRLFVSPSLGAPEKLCRAAWLTLLPGGGWLLHKRYRVKEGDRQPLRFRWKILRKYSAHAQEAFAAAREGGYNFAFFGKYDHYMRSGVVSIERWKALFGEDSYALYEGSHFMEEEYVEQLLVPKIREILDLKK